MPLDTAIVRPAFSRPLDLKELFGRDVASLELDVGCGKGRFLLARAKAHPDIAYLGIDRLAKRLKIVDRRLAKEQLSNVRLLQLEAAYVVECLLPASSVSACYMFFPDPWPKRRHHKRRLFTPVFLDTIHRALAPGGLIHVKTDHADYAAWIRKVMTADPRFEEVEALQTPEEEQTHFEIIFLGKGVPISRCSFRKK